jgi:uncharacterized membrane protein
VREVVGRPSQEEQLLDPRAVSMHRLTNPAGRLARAEDLLDVFSCALADELAGSACRASVNRRATRAAVVLRHMRRHTTGAAIRHEARCVVVLVGPNRNRGAGSLRRVGENLSWSVSFGRAAGLRHLRVHRQTMPVIREQLTDVAKRYTGAPVPAKQLRLAVRARFVRLVTTPLSAPVLALTRTPSSGASSSDSFCACGRPTPGSTYRPR